mgnify:FL=1
MDKVQKKGKKRLLVPLFAMISVVVFLWEGCRQGNHKEHPLSSQITNGELTEAQADSLKEDSLKIFYERMRRWNALHGGILHRESDK